MGERFGVRNAGCSAVVEGAGDHLGEPLGGVGLIGWLHCRNGSRLVFGRSNGVPSGELTWQLKSSIFNRRYIFTRSIFCCHVSLLEGIQKHKII